MNTSPFKENSDFNFVGKEENRRILLLIGSAGSGKTTLTLRLTKMLQEKDQFVFYIPLMNLSKNEKFSVKELFLGFPFRLHGKPESNLDKFNLSFKWIVNNQSRCTLICDGLDQCDFSFKDTVENYKYESKLEPGKLLRLIFFKKILPDLKVVVTSRNVDSFLFKNEFSLPYNVIFIKELSFGDAKKLLKYYCSLSSEDVDRAIKTMKKNPLVFKLFQNPLFLKLISAYINILTHQEFLHKLTTSKLFLELIERHQNSGNFNNFELENENDFLNLNKKLCNLAFDKTKQNKMIFTVKELKEVYNLEPTHVEDFMEPLSEIKPKGLSLKIKENCALSFNHQVIQVTNSMYFLNLFFFSSFSFIKKIALEVTGLAQGSASIWWSRAKLQTKNSRALIVVLVISFISNSRISSYKSGAFPFCGARFACSRALFYLSRTH